MFGGLLLLYELIVCLYSVLLCDIIFDQYSSYLLLFVSNVRGELGIRGEGCVKAVIWGVAEKHTGMSRRVGMERSTKMCATAVQCCQMCDGDAWVLGAAI